LLTRLTQFAAAAFVMTGALHEAQTARDGLERRVAERTNALTEAHDALHAIDVHHRSELERLVRERTADLQASRDLLQATLDSSMDLIQVFEAVRNESGAIVDFRWRLNNHEAERRYGEVRGRSLLERNPGVVQEGIFDAFMQVVETGRPSCEERHYAHEQFDGWFFQSVVKLDDGVATTTKDITAWKATQEELLRLRDAVAQAKVVANEVKYRNLFDSIDEGFCIVEMIFDEWERPVDYRFLSVNRAFENQTGLSNVTGMTMSRLVSGNEPHWFETYGRIALSGQPERFEARAEALGRWYEVYAFRIGAPEQRQVAILFKNILPRKNAEAALRESEERFRAFVTASSDMVYRMNPDWTEIRRLEGGAFLGDSDGLGSFWLDDNLHPDDRTTVHAAIAAAIAARSIFELEYRLIRADGSLGWILSRAVPILTETGEIREWLGTASDVTARKTAETALRASEERLTQFGEASSDVLWIRDAATFQWMYLTPAFETIYGLDRATALSGDNMVGWIEMIVPEDREHAMASLQRVRTGERVTFEYRVRQPGDGAIRWLRNTDFPMRDATGAICWIGGVGRDITEEKETAARMSVLVAELQHRTRNLLSVVRAMADKTLRRSTDLADFKVRFGARLAALARVQGLLSRLGEGERVTFDDLIRSEVAALDGDSGRVSLRGPSGVALRSSTLQTFALALHELATNAVKHGAFGQPQASLEIRWSVESLEAGQGPWLHMEWRECGVRIPADHASREGGSGRELIERALPYQLGARTTYVMEADGVRCTIALPVSERTTGGRHAEA
jgi:PAS domain S-box-containing protein